MSKQLDFLQSIWNRHNSIVVASSLTTLFVTIYSLTRRRKVKLIPQNNVILITGCDSGFGYLSASLLASSGFRVVVTCMTDEGIAALGPKVALAVKCDVTKELNVVDLIVKLDDFLKKENCRLWAVVNNAGIAPSGYIDWTSMETFQKVMDVNYFGVVRMIKATLPLLKQTNNSRIIILSSMAGHVASPGLGAYAATKHAIEGLVKAIRPELNQWGIHVANVNPAFMRTPLIASSIKASNAELERAPDHIRCQYPADIMKESESKILQIMESPDIVAQEIAELVTDRSPPQCSFVGVQAAVLRCSMMLPYSVQEFMAGFFIKTGSPFPDVRRAIQKN